jgi:hypothetical protein
MRDSILASLIAVAALATAACSSGGNAPSADPTPDPSRSERVVAQAEAASVRWTGSLQPVQQQSGDITPRASNRVFGSVTLTVAKTSAARTRAQITISTQLSQSQRLRWALVAGRCGSSDLPVTGVEQFPEIPISSNGRGELDGEIPVAIPTSGMYHVNVFWTTGADISDVMTCANLRMQRR